MLSGARMAITLLSVYGPANLMCQYAVDVIVCEVRDSVHIQ